jgi:hypothetical protein
LGAKRHLRVVNVQFAEQDEVVSSSAAGNEVVAKFGRKGTLVGVVQQDDTVSSSAGSKQAWFIPQGVLGAVGCWYAIGRTAGCGEQTIQATEKSAATCTVAQWSPFTDSRSTCLLSRRHTHRHTLQQVLQTAAVPGVGEGPVPVLAGVPACRHTCTAEDLPTDILSYKHCNTA